MLVVFRRFVSQLESSVQLAAVNFANDCTLNGLWLLPLPSETPCLDE